MKKIRILLVVFLLSSVGVMRGNAQDKVPGIIVELSTGEKVEYMLTENPKFTYDGQTITLTAKGVKLEYTPTQLARVTTGDVTKSGTSGIELSETQQGDIKVEAGFVRLSGFTSGEPVRIYSVGGSLVATHKIESDGSLVIPVSTLPSGISIIKANQQTIKITRK